MHARRRSKPSTTPTMIGMIFLLELVDVAPLELFSGEVLGWVVEFVLVQLGVIVDPGVTLALVLLLVVAAVVDGKLELVEDVDVVCLSSGVVVEGVWVVVGVEVVDGVVDGGVVVLVVVGAVIVKTCVLAMGFFP